MSESPRYVFVTGGTGGIGVATCAALANAGLRPLIGYRNDEGAARAIASRCGGDAIHCDMMNANSIAGASDAIVAQGHLAGVVLAASPPPTLAPFSRVSLEDMQAQWLTNVAGPHLLLQRLVRQCFQPRKTGVVLGILTAAMGVDGRPPARSMSAYVIGKHGLFGLLSVLAAEYPWLRVRTIRPGYVRTRMLDVFDERFLDMQAEVTPIRSAEDVAQSIMAELAL